MVGEVSSLEMGWCSQPVCKHGCNADTLTVSTDDWWENIMKIAAYLRVSTDRQAEHGHGLDIQRAEIEAWAERNGHEIVLWAKDEGISGSNGLDTRVGLYEAVSATQEDSVQGLVVYRLDRLARDLILQETVLQQVWKHGARVFSTVAGEDDLLDPDGTTDDPSRKMTRQILGAVAEYERATIRLRLRSGKLAKRARGGYIGGAVPMGFQLGDDGGLVPQSDEQAALKRMRELRADGSTLRVICDALTAEGFSTRGGGPWQTAVVGRILKRDK